MEREEQELNKLFDFFREIDREKLIGRQTFLADGSRKENDVAKIIYDFAKRGKIGAMHVRNIKFTGDKQFYEAAHLSSAGSLDMYEIMKALYDADFKGYLRPDHGRMIWGETGRPGYGLYDRALGAMYIAGIWETLEKTDKKKM